MKLDYCKKVTMMTMMTVLERTTIIITSSLFFFVKSAGVAVEVWPAGSCASLCGELLPLSAFCLGLCFPLLLLCLGMCLSFLGVLLCESVTHFGTKFPDNVREVLDCFKEDLALFLQLVVSCLQISELFRCGVIQTAYPIILIMFSHFFLAK